MHLYKHLKNNSNKSFLFINFCHYFSRYHNGTLLDRKVYKYEEDLVLRDLKLEQAGQYYCKTSSPAGSIKSSPASLTVIGMYNIECLTEKVSEHKCRFLPSQDPNQMVKNT